MARTELRAVDQNFEAFEEVDSRFDGPPGGGNNGDMDARISRLEDFAEKTSERLTRVETTLEHIEHEVTQTKWWLIGSTLTIILTVIATVIGTGVGIQQMTVATFQAAANNTPVPASPAPIIINVPAAPSAVQEPKK